MATIETVREPITGAEPPGDPRAPEEALSLFYRAFNRRDLALMERSWSNRPDASLDNPLGGIRRGWPEIREVYRRIFGGAVSVEVEFFDYTLHRAGELFYAVGRERGRAAWDGGALDLAIRTTRVFRLEEGSWRQVHHHGSFDDPALLAAYQRAVSGATSPARDGRAGASQARPRVAFRTAHVAGVDVSYREAGPPGAPALLLLHGFPSSSRMFMPLLPLLAHRHRLIAPDLPGFGHSSAPPPESFAYTFDHLAEVVDALCSHLGLSRYALYLQDYGGPVGFRLALAHPERVRALVIQNAAAHEEGLSPAWDLRRAFWRDRARHEAEVRRAMLSLESARARHVHGPRQELVDPDTWRDEHAFLHRDGMDRIQLELAYDYRTNLAAYPAWQRWLREAQPPLLVAWGRHDPLFTERGAWAYRDDVPGAEVQLLDAGHFALDLEAEAVGELVDAFLTRRAAA
jgi:pimeloyl-ACP methyl ester carboxylesterase/ketosteroid isomerase-like protein